MDDCIFCKIVQGEIPSETIFENDDIKVFKDIYPKAPIHYLLVPKKHISSLIDLEESDSDLIGQLALTAKRIAVEQGFADSGFRFIANNGRDSGQEVDHLHFHILAGRRLSGMG